ncbi:MAG: mannose-6-phosphate isomerase, class I [Bacteroidota bacterium]|nr:mannose-6-phosphate isomerase, class I [Bacteroidota bacterium]
MSKEHIYKLKGKIMHYAWGGDRFLPEFLGIQNPEHKPFAEYWMGAHPMAPAELETPEGNQSLFTLIQEKPEEVLSEKVFDRFGELPYLFKVQDVNEILSIQVHPSKEEAEKGFDREEAEGIPIQAPYRNYKDRNHKPEVMVALSDFWLLHGFRQLPDIEKTLQEVPEFNILLPLFRKQGLKALYQFVMEMDQVTVNSLLANLVKRELRKKQEGLLDKTQPGWWVARIFANKKEIGDIDRAVFSIYLFNIVSVKPGESVFQNAGIPHAYMEGQCVELMANSDNVLRAGLTPKHIDVPELLKHTQFTSIVPNVMKGDPSMTGEKIYPCPVPDFGIAKIELNAQVSYQNQSASLEIILVTEGGVVINNQLVLKRGEAAALFANETYQITASGHSTLFKAFVPH